MQEGPLYVVISREPGKPFRVVSDPISKGEAAVRVEQEWAKRHHARRVAHHLIKTNAA